MSGRVPTLHSRSAKPSGFQRLVVISSGPYHLVPDGQVVSALCSERRCVNISCDTKKCV
jgi:hypothetical protein